ncbi:hypothetical protein NHX12_025476 [Muraenolepis orangiensis]|uniref:DUF4211 domain-containing protein n=1 Tax=Muraenolepis orangiensis TaxID=630683 RepID=A0A9Q0EK27_9TELE|nr:hypothetical protein NHX12_025476 [Muraenolepis orangiensis]
MDRNYPGAGFGDLAAGPGWSYERSAKASLMYGSSRSSHPDSELLHRQAYATPHPLQGYATNHHPGSSGQGGAWGAAGRSLGLSGLFDTGLHHASPSGPDASVMNLISALESRGQQPPPAASSLLSQFRTPSWQTAMHTPAPAELFISGALPGSASFPSSSALSAYQHPASFSSRSFPSLQDTPTFSPTSNGLLSPHDPLLHIKASSQSGLGFDRLLSSQSASYRGAQDPGGDSVIKHYQRPGGPPHSLQHYLSCGGAGYQHLPSHHRHAGLSSCSPLGEQSPSSDHKPAATARPDQYRPIIQPPTPHTPPSASSTSSSSSSSSAPSGPHPSASSSSSAPSRQQPPPQPPPPVPPQPPPVSASSVPRTLPKACLSGYGSPAPTVKTPSSSLTGQTPPQQQIQSYSPNQPPSSHLSQSYSPNQAPASSHLSQSYGGFSSPQAQDLSSAAGAKGYGGVGGRSQAYSADVYAADSAYGSLPSSLGGAGSPSLGYGAPGHSPALLRSGGSSGGSASGSGGGAGGGGGLTNERAGSGGGSYHIPDSSPSPSGNSAAVRSGLPSPSQSPGGTGSNKYLSSVLSPGFLSSPQGAYPDSRGVPSSQTSYHPAASSSKPKADSSSASLLSQRSQEEVDDEDFLIEHLLQAQASPAPQNPQSGAGGAGSGGGKGLSYDLAKSSEERYHLQSVIRTHTATSGSGGGAGGGAASGLDTQLEMATSGEGGGVSLMDSPTDRQPPHLLQSHQSHHKMDSHSQHALGQQQLGSGKHSAQPQGSQLQIQLQSQALEAAHYGQQDQGQAKHQGGVSSLDMLERSLAQTAEADDERQGGHPSNSDLHPFLSEADLGLSQRETQQTLSQSQSGQEQHQFDQVSPVDKAAQNQQSNRFVPLTSICFPDSLLQDEDRSFFPGMEDMFCPDEYKPSCQEMNSSQTGQEGLDSMKGGQGGAGAGSGGGSGYDMMGHHRGEQSYGPYCHGLEDSGPGPMTLDLDSLKRHELPSTVNTEQLGLIQSQGPPMGLGPNCSGSNNATGGKLPPGAGGAGGPASGGLQSPIFCSSRPKKLLKSSSYHLLKERRDPSSLPKKSYAQEYEFEDDEDKADQPADIRLNSRRRSDLLPDLDGPKKRGRKPTKPKREGPPRPRGRPRIRPLPEPYAPRGAVVELGAVGAGPGFSGEGGRGRGRGRGGRGRGGRREDMLMEMKEQDQHLLSHHQQVQHEPIPPLKIKLPIGTMASDSLLRTDSLSGTDPALSDGSLGSAPSLGLSPGAPCSADSSRSQDKRSRGPLGLDGGEDAGLEDRTGKRPVGMEMDPVTGDSSPSPCKLRPLSPVPVASAFGEGPEEEEDSVGRNQDLQKSISSAISALYDTPQLQAPPATPTPPPLTPTLQPPVLSPQRPHPSPTHASSPTDQQPALLERPEGVTSLHLAQKQGGAAILALQTGREPPPIWRVQKALLQKFSPEIKDGQRQFCATSNYLGYFGDAKRRYQRLYVKFLENVSKKDFVRVCSRRPWRRTGPGLRRQPLLRVASQPPPHPPTEKEEKAAPPPQREKTRSREKREVAAKEEKEEREKERGARERVEKQRRVQLQQRKGEKRGAERGKERGAERGKERGAERVKERGAERVKEKGAAERPVQSKQSRSKTETEPPPKKRKEWQKEASSSSSDSSSEASEDEPAEQEEVQEEENRVLREMFRSYVEMLVSTALDPDMIQALEDTHDELYLPPMRKIDSMLNEQKRRLLRRVSMSTQHQEVLHAYPQIQVDHLDSGQFRVRLAGDAYNRKTLNRVKKSQPRPQEVKLSADLYRLYSLYHSLHHYKYHTFLLCRRESHSVEQAADDPGQEEVVQQCMANHSWLDTLYGAFTGLLALSAKA